MNRDRLARWLYPIAGFVLLVFSLHVLQQELDRYNFQDILQSLSSIEERQLYAAFGLVLFDYLVISSYDLIAFRHFNYCLTPKKILFTTFVTYAVSNTTGFTLLIGGAIRYHFYSLWQVPAKKIAKITAFGNLTFWLGLLTLVGITLAIAPFQLPVFLNTGALASRSLGVAALILVVVYFYCCWRIEGLKIKHKILRFPKPITSLIQIAIFASDWALAAAILYCLIPDYLGKSYLQFFNVYLLSMATSILSSIPGGIGVFETVIIFLLPQNIFTPDILSSLLVYRAIRFLLPLAVAGITVCCFELGRKFGSINR